MGFSKVADKREKRLEVRVTEAEKAVLNGLAADARLDVSEFIRRRALGRPVRNREDVHVITELMNYRQVLIELHRSQAVLPEEMLVQLRDAIIETIDRVWQNP